MRQKRDSIEEVSACGAKKFPSFWMALSFAPFAFVLVKKAIPVVLGALDGHIASVRKDLADAKALRLEAEALLADYQQKQRDALKEAEFIIENARDQARIMQEQAEAALNETIQRREHMLEDRLKFMEESAVQRIRSYAADLAVHVSEQLIQQNISQNDMHRLTEQSIAKMGADFINA